MKNLSFLQVAFILILMVSAVSCTVIREAGYGDEEVGVGQRRGSVYYNNPGFYGNDVIVVERDPFTGRYYQVSPYGGSYYGSGVYPYNNGYNNRYYNRNYNNNPRTYNNVPRQSAPSPQNDAKREEARRRILGEKN